VNRKTAIAGKGTFTWKLILVVGKKYTVSSDAHPKLKKTFTPLKAPPKPA
jgi:hypothetical protein